MQNGLVSYLRVAVKHQEGHLGCEGLPGKVKGSSPTLSSSAGKRSPNKMWL